MAAAPRFFCFFLGEHFVIIATNRIHDRNLINRVWDDKPDAEGTVHWLNIDPSSLQITDKQTSTDDSLPTSIKAEICGAGDKHFLLFVPGARRFKYIDFVNFAAGIEKAGFKGTVLGFSPPFSSGFSAINLSKQFHKSHCSRKSLSNALDALLSVSDSELSLMLQSAGNDVYARALDARGKHSLPNLKYVISAASPIKSNAYSKAASAANAAAVDGKAIENATLAIESCEHFTAYYRSDDWVLWLLEDALGNVPPNDPYLYQDKVSFVGCDDVPTPNTTNHKCYEIEPPVVSDLVKVLNGRKGDYELPLLNGVITTE